jgi:hypothetical protein
VFPVCRGPLDRIYCTEVQGRSHTALRNPTRPLKSQRQQWVRLGFDDTGFASGFTLKVVNRPADYEYTTFLRSTFAVLRNPGSLASAASDKIRQAGGERMRSVRSRTGPWAAVLALILGVVARVGSAQAVEAGRYAPENIEQTYKQMRWLCMVAALCPVSDDVRIVIKRAIEGKPSAEYLLGLTLLTGDGLPRDESAGIAWTVRAAKHGPRSSTRIRRSNAGWIRSWSKHFRRAMRCKSRAIVRRRQRISTGGQSRSAKPRADHPSFSATAGARSSAVL